MSSVLMLWGAVCAEPASGALVSTEGELDVQENEEDDNGELGEDEDEEEVEDAVDNEEGEEEVEEEVHTHTHTRAQWMSLVSQSTGVTLDKG